jgi:class 3 adenylate cyclase
MEVTTRIAYDVDKSSGRMDDILNASSGNFSDKDSIPARSSLTYTNGFYVNVTALFIDIADSSDMTDDHKRPTLAKIYRSFISECTAIMNSESTCKEINIHGDCVWGVFETPTKSDVDAVFSVSAKLNSLIKILNYKLRKKGYSEISVGIGIDDGRALMVKAGYSGSGLNDVIWMGDVVNSASKISGIAGRNGRKSIFVSGCIYSNLNEHNQKLLSSTIVDRVTYYSGNTINSAMDKWYEDNCK